MRLLVHVEGQTEEAFVNEVLRSYLCSRGYSDVSARLVGNARTRKRRGGRRAWLSVRKEIVAHLRQDPTCVATTMVDFYALPDTWPGRTATGLPGSREKALSVERALQGEVALEMGRKFNPYRFVPSW